MNQLTEIETIRFSKEDVEIMLRLKLIRIKPHAFIRAAFREKLERDYKSLVKIQDASDENLPF